ncbi:MAG TPA: cytochrome c [Kiloniellales bacterium]|nr:cytochrome c [Kiloniellales bacterium]
MVLQRSPYETLRSIGLIAALLAAVPASAQQTEPIWPKLTPKLQGLLQREMVSILDASHHILDALVMGDAVTVASEARAIERSFIMEQSMTEQDRKNLMTVLPTAFVELDGQFHQTAANLAAAAESKDLSRAHAEFSKMIQTCRTCHARFATDRFPSFTSD